MNITAAKVSQSTGFTNLALGQQGEQSPTVVSGFRADGSTPLSADEIATTNAWLDDCRSADRILPFDPQEKSKRAQILTRIDAIKADIAAINAGTGTNGERITRIEQSLVHTERIVLWLARRALAQAGDDIVE